MLFYKTKFATTALKITTSQPSVSAQFQDFTGRNSIPVIILTSEIFCDIYIIFCIISFVYVNLHISFLFGSMLLSCHVRVSE